MLNIEGINCNYKSFISFRDYVLVFYGPDGLYEIKDLTCLDVVHAIYDYFKLCVDPNHPYNWGDGDSIDRESVRNIIEENAKVRA